MSKYEPLWAWILTHGEKKFSLTYEEIEKIVGIPLDHSFLTYKKELFHYGYQVKKISMKQKMIEFEKIETSV